MTKIYCIDASSLIHAWHAAYPIEAFPTVWKQFAAAIADGKLISPKIVQEELKRKDDGLSKWAKKQASLFSKMTNDETQLALEIVRLHPSLVDTQAPMSRRTHLSFR